MPAERTSLRHYLLPPLMAAALGVVVYGAVNTLVATAERLGPGVGDIVSFPADPHAAPSHVRVTVEREGGGHCDLAVSTLRRSGGSFVVQERRPTGVQLRVGWAGAHTTYDASDCGAAGALWIKATDMAEIAVAAGGYGVQVVPAGNPVPLASSRNAAPGTLMVGR